jgi:hypothetical protein
VQEEKNQILEIRNATNVFQFRDGLPSSSRGIQPSRGAPNASKCEFLYVLFILEGYIGFF